MAEHTSLRRVPRTLALWLGALLCAALAFCPRASAASYDEALNALDRLQTLADSYLAENANDADAIDLALTYTRNSEYSSAIWQLTAGARDPGFDEYVNTNAPDLADLQYIGSVSLPNGQNTDFNHLLASLQLTYRGLPVPGGWGGDSMQLARSVQGQAADVDGYMALMQTSFNAGGGSVFGNEDLRADLDAVVLGAQLTAESRLASLLREYYTPTLTDYDRAYQFIALSFGNVNTGSQGTFRQTVYNTLTEDSGMQLLLYLNGSWQKESWQLAAESEPALHAASNVFADYLATAVNGERVHSDATTRMMTMSGQALADTLAAMGDEEAANAALSAWGSGAAQGTVVADGVDGVLDDATQRLRSGFDVALFRAILLVVCGAAAVGLVACIALMIHDLGRRW